jgi:electron transfer flavoprotein alpha subunit
VTAAVPLRVAAVLDATGPAAARHARALGGFLRDGLALAEGAQCEAVTHVFCLAGAGRDDTLAQAPTSAVRLIRVPPRRPDAMTAALAAFQAGDGADLFVFPGGPTGGELAARLAARTGGTALTGVLAARLTPAGITCRRAVYSGHLTGEFALGARPWCIALDAGWADASVEPPSAHVVHAEAELPVGGVPAPGPLLEVEQLEPPPTGDLETARFLVVAGRGAGGRGGVERLAAAATRMGAAFGVTRPVAMNAWAAPDRQVGVSGTRTSPAVCVVAGASGAPAFLWGVERAGFIAAVDTDADAPIAGEADALLVDDAVAVVEALADLVERERR